MSAWRVGSKTKVTLFKGKEIWGILQSEEKAAVVVRWLNWAESLSEGGDPSLEQLSDEELQQFFDEALFQLVRRGRMKVGGVEAPGGAPEGGAEGDPAAAVPDDGVGDGDPVGAGDSGGGAERGGDLSI